MFKLLKMMVLILLLWPAPSSASQVPEDAALLDQSTSEHIEALLESRGALSAHLVSVSRLLSHEQISGLYQQRNFLPIWIHGGQLKPEAHLFLEYLRNAGAHGLCGNDFLLAELEDLILIQKNFARHNLPLASDSRAVLDLFLSQAFLTYTTDMVEGQVDPTLAHVDWRARRRKADLIKLLEYAVDEQRLPQVVEGLVPPHKEYQKLMVALDKYQRISALGGWPAIPPGSTIRPGDLDERVPILRALLQTTGDLESDDTATQTYDAPTSEALRLFQFRHGLVTDGVIGAKTLAVLNVSVEERIRQIELNLERWRWMPKSFGERHIRVNIAAFALDVVEEDEIVMQMPVIVGTQYRKTPVFSAQMTYLEFAPYWIVPPTILREDKLPQIKKNPDYLAEKNFRIISGKDDNSTLDPQEIDWSAVEAKSFPGLLRMEPGPWNPLGRVKFMFPNKFNVYLHDTNETALFEENIRSFSSGCIRVKRPYDLARLLLGKDFDQNRLQALFAATTPEQVSIKALPVHVQYWTAWVSQDDLVHFRSDVYYRDLDLDIALKEPAYRVLDQLKVSTGKHLAKN